MRRAFLHIIIVAMILAILMTGCGKSSNHSPTPVEATPASSNTQTANPEPAAFPQHPGQEATGTTREAQTAEVDISVLLGANSTSSNIRFSSPANVTYMKANIEVIIISNDVELGIINNERQHFQGSIQGHLIKGSIENKVIEYSGENAPLLPFESPAEFSQYLQPEAYIESDDPLIVQKTNDLTYAAPNAWEAALAIAKWVHANIIYEPGSGSGASQTLANQKGDSAPQALIAIAMCRAAGIPSRLVGGLAYNNNQFKQHYWTECFLGDAAGWIPFDPVDEEYGWIDATHISLFHNGGIESLTSVEVIDYADKGEAGAGESSKLDLSVGQMRHYSFTDDGAEFGYNEYQVTIEDNLQGTRVYTIKSTLHLEPSASCKPTEATAFLQVSEAANPISYEADTQTGKG